MPIPYLSQIKRSEIAGKACLLRADLNIEKGFEKDAFRIQTIIPTIKFLLKNKCKIIIVSHRGRPATSKKLNVKSKKYSLRIFQSLIAKHIKKPVAFLPNLNFQRSSLLKLKSDVLLLENLRFWEGEEKNDPALAKQLATLGDFYVNDAFPVCHRNNASVVAITKFLPSYAGLRLEEEIKNLDAAMQKPKHPVTIIIGGAKIADKLGVVQNFWRKADYFLFGGGPANTLLSAKGLDVGDSLIDNTFNNLRSSQDLRLENVSPKIFLPSDFKKSGNKILDIGPKTIKEYAKIIQKSQTIIWNGPMGLFENKKFAGGTIAIWKAIIDRVQGSGFRVQVVIGGGETIASLSLLHPQPSTLNPSIFLSTGGGAMLEYLSGKKLPGIEKLKY